MGVRAPFSSPALQWLPEGRAEVVCGTPPNRSALLPSMGPICCSSTPLRCSEAPLESGRIRPASKVPSSTSLEHGRTLLSERGKRLASVLRGEHPFVTGTLGCETCRERKLIGGDEGFQGRGQRQRSAIAKRLGKLQRAREHVLAASSH